MEFLGVEKVKKYKAWLKTTRGTQLSPDRFKVSHATEEGQESIRHRIQHSRNDARAAACGERGEIWEGKGR